MFRSVSLPRSGSASKIGTPAPDPVKLIYNMQSRTDSREKCLIQSTFQSLKEQFTQK